MINATTREKIKGYLEAFVDRKIEEHKQGTIKPTDLRPTLDFSPQGGVKPFHEALIPSGIMTISEFERTFSTTLGTTFEEAAKLIAIDNHGRAVRSERVEGRVSLKAVALIESIKRGIDSNGMKRPFPELVNEVVSASKEEPKGNRWLISDLYVRDKDGIDYYFEIKTPKPNKGQCLEVTERLLHVHAIRSAGLDRVRTYFAMAYNPYGRDKSSYKHSFSLKYLDLENQVVMGKDFWEIVGGRGTYEQVLEVYREVGKEKGPAIIKGLLA